LDLSGMVQYAEGSIVSRTLTETDAGTLTVFAFAEGQGLSEHSAPFDAIVQIVEGRATVTVGTQSVDARAGQLVRLPAGVPHSIEPGGSFKMLLTMFRAGQ
jgi:quercetin dioxygenase-like cupin family protein